MPDVFLRMMTLGRRSLASVSKQVLAIASYDSFGKLTSTACTKTG